MDPKRLKPAGPIINPCKCLVGFKADRLICNPAKHNLYMCNEQMAARLRLSDTSKSEEAWCRLGLGLGCSVFRSEVASAILASYSRGSLWWLEQMALGTYDGLVGRTSTAEQHEQE